jgi:putative lipoprotein
MRVRRAGRDLARRRVTGAPRVPLALLLAVLVGVGLAACGRKGPPVAPERRVPQPVTDLRGLVREGAVELSWSLPRRRIDNVRLLDLDATRVFRAEDAGEGEPRSALLRGDRIPGYTEIGSIRLADAQSAVGPSGRVTFTDRRGLVVGHRYTYVVVTTDRQGRTSPPSPRLSLAFLAPPRPPDGLKTEPGERQVRLSWVPPTHYTDETPITGPLTYEILRAPSAEAPLTVVRRTAPGDTSATDGGLENDRDYSYAVRAIRESGATVVEGEATSRVAAMPTDVTPPAPPANLVAIPSERTVRLSWTAGTDADLAGYVVYRATGAGPWIRVGSVPAPATTFTDREVPAGTYRYAVTARDTSVRANESGRSNEVAVTLP